MAQRSVGQALVRAGDRNSGSANVRMAPERVGVPIWSCERVGVPIWSCSFGTRVELGDRCVAYAAARSVGVPWPQVGGCPMVLPPGRWVSLGHRSVGVPWSCPMVLVGVPWSYTWSYPQVGGCPHGPIPYPVGGCPMVLPMVLPPQWWVSHGATRTRVSHGATRWDDGVLGARTQGKVRGRSGGAG